MNYYPDDFLSETKTDSENRTKNIEDFFTKDIVDAYIDLCNNDNFVEAFNILFMKLKISCIICARNNKTINLEHNLLKIIRKIIHKNIIDVTNTPETERETGYYLDYYDIFFNIPFHYLLINNNTDDPDREMYENIDIANENIIKIILFLFDTKNIIFKNKDKDEDEHQDIIENIFDLLNFTTDFLSELVNESNKIVFTQMLNMFMKTNIKNKTPYYYLTEKQKEDLIHMNIKAGDFFDNIEIMINDFIKEYEEFIKNNKLNKNIDNMKDKEIQEYFKLLIKSSKEENVILEKEKDKLKNYNIVFIRPYVVDDHNMCVQTLRFLSYSFLNSTNVSVHLYIQELFKSKNKHIQIVKENIKNEQKYWLYMIGDHFYFIDKYTVSKTLIKKEEKKQKEEKKDKESIQDIEVKKTQVKTNINTDGYSIFLTN